MCNSIDGDTVIPIGMIADGQQGVLSINTG